MGRTCLLKDFQFGSHSVKTQLCAVYKTLTSNAIEKTKNKGLGKDLPGK